MSGAQKQFRAIQTELDALRNKEAMTPDDMVAFKGKLNLAQTLKAQVEDEQALDALKAWGNERQESAVVTGWSGEAGDNEGEIPGLTADIKTGEYHVRETVAAPQLYDPRPMAAKKLKVLRSGSYKDAMNQYIRSRGQKMDMKVLQEGVDESGGFWVTPDFRPEVIKKMATIPGVKDDVNEFATGKDIVSFPKVTYTADNNYTSGTRMAWTAQNPGSDISEATNPVAGRITIPIHTATATIFLTREQTEDNDFDLMGYVSQLMGEAFALGKDDVYINGTGVGQPQGILSHTQATVAHNFTTQTGGMYVPSGISAAVSFLGTSVGTPEYNEGFSGMEAALPPQYENGAKWYANKAAYAQAKAVTDTAGRPLWLPQDQYSNFAQNIPANIYGYPIVKDQFVPVPAASSYSVIFGKLSGYLAPQRVGISIEVLRELKALQGLVVIYARARFGGMLAYDWQVKLMKLATS